MTNTQFRVAVMISGRGSNLESLISSIKTHAWPIEIVLVVSDNPKAPGLRFAEWEQIPIAVVERGAMKRPAYDHALAEAIAPHNPDLIVLAGFMRVLGTDFIRRFAGKIINIHPSLLPSFRGLDVHRAAIQAGVKFSGSTVHYVVEQVDAGPIIAQSVVPVLPDDDEESLAERILKTEHQILPAAVHAIAAGKIRRRRIGGGEVVHTVGERSDGVLLSLK